MVRNLILSVCVLSVSIVFGQDLKTIKIDDGKIKIKIPTVFLEMTPDDMFLRYPSVRKPIAAYSSEDRLSDLSIKISATQWAAKDIEIASSFFKASIFNLIDKVKMIDEGIRVIHGRKFVFYEFDSHLLAGQSGSPERKYNYIMYNVGIERTLVVSFRCPDYQKEDFIETVHEAMSSIKIKR